MDYKVLLAHFLANKLYTNADSPAADINIPKGSEPSCVTSTLGRPEKCTMSATATPKTINSLFFIHLDASVL